MGGSVMAGGVASLIAGAATGLGALPLLVRRRWTDGTRMLMLAWAGGVMLGATMFSLCVPALELVTESSGSELKAALVVAGGVLLGAIGIWALQRLMVEPPGETHVSSTSLGYSPATLFVIAISLHNLPEGMSVGVAYAADEGAGLAVALGIGLQNIPEGFAVAAAMRADGASIGRATGISLASGLVEPIGGVLGALAVSMSITFLPWGLSLAAGAMLYVICADIIPETHQHGRARMGTLSLVGGFVLMMVLDVVLG